MKAPIPILRSFDEAKTKQFYLGFLGFQLNWEHRFGENFPLYLQVSRGACVLHLSEHFGDAAPGSALRIETSGLEEYVAGLRAQDYRHAKPGPPALTEWKTKELTITDPSGNRLIFFEPVGA
jgi:hypothetical protein